MATIATMPSRLATFRQMLPTILDQVDRVFVYLDGFDAVPAFLAELDRVEVHRAEQLGNLHASSRFLCLKELSGPTVVLSVDDDIAYPPDYAVRLTALLGQLAGRAVVGVHGRIFLPQHLSYVHDASMFHFTASLERHRFVHELGTGTSAFVSSLLELDPLEWDRFDMDDIVVAIEAQRRGLPRIAIARPKGWLTALAQDQEDSLWVRCQRDETEQVRRMRTLLSLYARA